MNLIEKYNIRAKKALWQNFLVNEDILNEISYIININWENIIEVWPGYWALTDKILEQKPNSLHLVELDDKMIKVLDDRTDNWDFNITDIDFEVFHQDILEFEPKFDNYSVIANIPYYITSPILRRFLYDLNNIPKNMVILMQKDVWDKILWKGKNKSSVLSLFIEKKCVVSEVLFVWKENFVPPPKVESSVLLFESHSNYINTPDDNFLKVIKAWFIEPRKKLVKNLVKGLYDKEKIIDFFQQNNLGENTRWEDLDIDTWIKLVEYLN